MRILTRYVLREFLVPVFYCTTAFTGIYIVFDLFDKFESFSTARPPFAVLLSYYGGYVAPLVQWLLPASLLLAGLYTMWQLSRNSEIIAMRASGVGFGAITAPLLWTAVVLATLSALNSEFYAPEASRRARALARNDFRSADAGLLHADVPYHNFADQRVWRVGQIDLSKPHELTDVRVTQSNTNGLPQSVVISPRAEYLDGVWWFHTPLVTHYDEQGNLSFGQPAGTLRRSVAPMPQFDETPRDFQIEQISKDRDARETMSLRDLVRYVKARPRLPRDEKVSLRYDIHHRLASPWACIVITLFAIPAGVASGRQSVFRGVVMAIGLFFTFYAVTQLCMALSKKDVLAVGWGAWLPNLVFLVAGLGLFARQR